MSLRVFCAALALAQLASYSWSGQLSAGEVRVLSGGAVRAPLMAVLPAFESRSGHRVSVSFAPAAEIASRVAAGESFDLLIVPEESVDAYEKDGRVAAGRRSALGRVGIGVAVNERAPAPDISTPESLKRALLDAKSLVYVDPARGTSGKHFAGVLEKLGIAEQVKARTTLLPGGYVVEPVGRGEIELGVQQITEILPVPGVKLVGPLPPALQKWTVYTAVATPAGASSDAVRDLIAYLTAPDASRIFEQKGLVGL